MRKWTKELLFEISKRFTTKKDFALYSKSAVNAAFNYGPEFYRECTRHMLPMRGCFTSDIGVIYQYRSEKFIYVGSTVQPSERHIQHLRRGPVFEKIQEGENMVYTVLESNIAFENILNREQHYIDLAKNMSCTLLNKCCAHSRGAIIRKWTRNAIFKEIVKYTTINEWRSHSKSSYNASLRLKVYEECKSRLKISYNKWTPQQALADARKYLTKNLWRSARGSSYSFAKNKKALFLEYASI